MNTKLVKKFTEMYDYRGWVVEDEHRTVYRVGRARVEVRFKRKNPLNEFTLLRMKTEYGFAKLHHNITGHASKTRSQVRYCVGGLLFWESYYGTPSSFYVHDYDTPSSLNPNEPSIQFISIGDLSQSDYATAVALWKQTYGEDYLDKYESISQIDWRKLCVEKRLRFSV